MLIGSKCGDCVPRPLLDLGLEGQMIWGGIGATIVSLYEIGPESIRIPTMILFAAALAMAWIAIAALLKIRLGVNEIISTLLMNYVALNFLLHLLYGPWRDPHDGFPTPEAFEPFEQLGQIGWGLSAALPLALVVALLVWWLLGFTRFGFYLRFVQANDRVAHAVGVPAVAVTLGAVLLSGALAGIEALSLSRARRDG